jgi:hypothetical protein
MRPHGHEELVSGPIVDAYRFGGVVRTGLQYEGLQRRPLLLLPVIAEFAAALRALALARMAPMRRRATAPTQLTEEMLFVVFGGHRTEFRSALENHQLPKNFIRVGQT